jgi:hypothetical protein
MARRDSAKCLIRPPTSATVLTQKGSPGANVVTNAERPCAALQPWCRTALAKVHLREASGEILSKEKLPAATGGVAGNHRAAPWRSRWANTNDRDPASEFWP